jgi:hypothetical protein
MNQEQRLWLLWENDELPEEGAGGKEHHGQTATKELIHGGVIGLLNLRWQALGNPSGTPSFDHEHEHDYERPFSLSS